MTNTTETEPVQADRRMTIEETEAVLTLVRGGWLRIELNLNEAGSTADISRQTAAQLIEKQIRQLQAAPADVTTVSRNGMAMDLQVLADDIRRGDA